MIYGDIKKLSCYKGISKNLDVAIDYILDGKYKENHFGKNEILGDDVYFNCPERPITKILSEGKLEAHKKYIDIHIVIEGKETIAFTETKNCKNITEYNEADDYYLLDGSFDIKFNLDNTKFLIFFPDEAHLAMLATENAMEIKKVIFKVNTYLS